MFSRTAVVNPFTLPPTVQLMLDWYEQQGQAPERMIWVGAEAFTQVERWLSDQTAVWLDHQVEEDEVTDAMIRERCGVEFPDNPQHVRSVRLHLPDQREVWLAIDSRIPRGRWSDAILLPSDPKVDPMPRIDDRLSWLATFSDGTLIQVHATGRERVMAQTQIDLARLMTRRLSDAMHDENEKRLLASLRPD